MANGGETGVLNWAPTQRQRSRLPALLYWLGVLVYAVSFVLPALGKIYGYQAFYAGACLLMSNHAAVAAPWLANPAFWTAVFYFKRRQPKAAVVVSLIAAFLAGSYVLVDGAGGLGIGYVAWVLSMATVAFAAGIDVLEERLARPDDARACRAAAMTNQESH